MFYTENNEIEIPVLLQPTKNLQSIIPVDLSPPDYYVKKLPSFEKITFLYFMKLSVWIVLKCFSVVERIFVIFFVVICLRTSTHLFCKENIIELETLKLFLLPLIVSQSFFQSFRRREVLGFKRIRFFFYVFFFR